RWRHRAGHCRCHCQYPWPGQAADADARCIAGGHRHQPVPERNRTAQAQMSTLPITTDDRLVWDTWLAQFRFPVVSVADEVGTFAAISATAKDTQQIAAELGVDARALGIHLGMLAAQGFVERREGKWRATAATRTWLHPEADGYAGPLIRRFAQNQPLHEQLMVTLR